MNGSPKPGANKQQSEATKAGNKLSVVEFHSVNTCRATYKLDAREISKNFGIVNYQAEKISSETLICVYQSTSAISKPT